MAPRTPKLEPRARAPSPPGLPPLVSGARRIPPIEQHSGDHGIQTAARDGHDVFGVRYPRMQMLTVPEILAEDRFTTPSVAARSVVAPRLPGT